MKMIVIKCVNKDCSVHGQEQRIPEGRDVAPGVIERLGTLTCTWCGHDMWTERT